MTEEKQKSEFVVFKKWFTFRTCSKCAGTGREETPLRHLTFVKDCPACFGTGQLTFATTEEVPLAEALSELPGITIYKDTIINVKAPLGKFDLDNQSTI
jgi:hypothetical protein